jgi:hypothetical protein
MQLPKEILISEIIRTSTRLGGKFIHNDHKNTTPVGSGLIHKKNSKQKVLFVTDVTD